MAHIIWLMSNYFWVKSGLFLGKKLPVRTIMSGRVHGRTYNLNLDTREEMFSQERKVFCSHVRSIPISCSPRVWTIDVQSAGTDHDKRNQKWCFLSFFRMECIFDQFNEFLTNQNSIIGKTHILVKSRFQACEIR